jgi:hypothetical protein
MKLASLPPRALRCVRFRAGTALLFGALSALMGSVQLAEAAGPIALEWVDSRKVEQIIGDRDWADGTATTSHTFKRFGVLANGLGYSFEHFNAARNRQELIFLFGDTVAFGSYSPSPGLDRNAGPVGAAMSVDFSHLQPRFECVLAPNDPLMVPCAQSAYNYHGRDPIAWSTTTDPQAGLKIDFFMKGLFPLFVEPSPFNGKRIKTGGDDIPNSGVSVNGKLYIVFSTGAAPSCGTSCSHAHAYSVLVAFDEAQQTFTTLRQISSVPKGGHFLFASFHEPALSPGAGGPAVEPVVYMFGVGDYRHSHVYLAKVPTAGFESGTGTRYLTAVNNGVPVWSPADAHGTSYETDAQPVFTDNAPSPSVGNISVAYEKNLKLWLMTYDADGTNPPATRGVFLRSAAAPWGPWSDPIPIFNACDNGGFGVAGKGGFIHYARAKSGVVCNLAAVSPSGPGGPTIAEEKGQHDPETTAGATFAPLMIERFLSLNSDLLSVYYTMSTWNPYTVVEMRTDLRVLPYAGAAQ